MFSARISGSHFNPSITCSYLFGQVKLGKSDGKFDLALGLFYILAQVAGAFVGCLVALIFNAGNEAKPILETGTEDNRLIWQSLVAETIAGFMVVFMYLCSTEDKTKFTKNAVLQTIVLACAYYSAMLLGG